MDKKSPIFPPYNFPIRAIKPPKIIARIAIFFLHLKPNIPNIIGITKAPEKIDSARNKVGSIYFIFKAINIEKNPKITIKILVINMAFLFFKSFKNTWVRSDEAVRRVVSAEDITADKSPKYKKKAIIFGSFVEAITRSTDSFPIKFGENIEEPYIPILAKI